MSRAGWPAPARTMATAVDSALGAALNGLREPFDDALVVLVRVDREQLATLLGTATQQLLERAHPDGLDADAAEVVLDRTVTAARPWYPDVDDDLLLQALTGALGIGAHADAPRADPDAVLAHGLLLVADLLGTVGARPAVVVDDAMAELVRAQTVEMP